MLNSPRRSATTPSRSSKPSSGLPWASRSSAKIDGQSTVVYQLPPDFRAATYLLDRIAGKPKQAVAVESDKINMQEAIALTEAASQAYDNRDDEAVT